MVSNWVGELNVKFYRLPFSLSVSRLWVVSCIKMFICTFFMKFGLLVFVSWCWLCFLGGY